MRYQNTETSLRLRSVQTILRYVLRKTEQKSDMTLDESLPLIAHIEAIQRQLGVLKSIAQEAAYVDMVEGGLDSLETPAFTATIKNTPSRVQVDNSGVAEQILETVIQKEIKRNKKASPMMVRSIAAKAFWTLFEAGSIKWRKTALNKLGVDLDDFSEDGNESHRIEVKVH